MTPKRRLFAFAATHGIEIEHERGARGGHHVTAHAPEGQVFNGNQLDLVCLWDGDRQTPPDWGECLADLRDNMMPLEPRT